MGLIRVPRHCIVSASVESVARRPLPETFTLTRVSGSEALHLANWVDTSARDYTEWEQQGGECLVGSVRGEAVFRAWQSMSPQMIAWLIPWIRAPERFAYLFDVETIPEHRGRGYAKSFLTDMVTRFAHTPTDFVLARVVTTNRPAMETFEAAGFQTDGVLTEWFVAGRRVRWRRERGR
jgi:ribosomal protein S18 acetylase RimI-like enzyme